MWHYLKVIIRTLKVNCVETLRKALSPLQLWLGVMILFFWHVCIAFVLWHNYSGIIWYWRGMESCTCTRSLRPLSCHCSLFHQAAHPAVLLTLGRPSSGYCFWVFLFVCLFFVFFLRECFALAVIEKQKLKTYLLQWQMAFRGHLFLEGKHVCPTYELISMATSQYDCGRNTKLLIPEHSN